MQEVITDHSTLTMRDDYFRVAKWKDFCCMQFKGNILWDFYVVIDLCIFLVNYVCEREKGER